MQTVQIIGKFTITDNDYFVCEHRVDGIHIMPGVTFLDMIFKTLKAKDFDIEQIELRNIMFLEPIVTTADFDRKVEIKISPNEKIWNIEASSTKWKNGELIDSNITKHLTCQLNLEKPHNQTPVDLLLLKNKAVEVVDLDACYAITRTVGIDHENFMKCSGTVYGSNYGCLGEIHLSSIAFQHSNDFILHPVFLDCSTIVPLYYSISNQNTAQLYVPFYIESFSGKGLTGRKSCYIYVEKPEQVELTKEIGYRSFVICDESGNRLATFCNFGIKKIHNIEVIRRLAKLEQKVESIILNQQYPEKHPVFANPELSIKHLVECIKKLIYKYTHQDLSDDLLESSFFELGLESTALLDISHELETLLNIRLYPTMLFEQPTVSKLAEFLWREHQEAVYKYLECQLTAVHSIEPGNLHHTNLSPSKAAENGHNNGHTKEVKLDDLSFTTQQSELIFIPKWQPTDISIVNNKSSDELNFEQIRSGKTLIVICGEYSPILQLLVNLHGVENSYIIKIGERCQNWQNRTAEVRHDQAKNWENILTELTSLSQVYFIVPSQKYEILFSHDYAFAFIKALISTGLTKDSIEFKIVTFNAVQVFQDEPFQPYDNGLWGLWKSFSREYKHCSVTFLDLAQHELEKLFVEEDTVWLKNVFQDGCISSNAFAIRYKQVYCQRLYSLAPFSREELSKFKQYGTYLIIGGTGGLGIGLTHYLRNKYSANIALVGRSPADNELLAKISNLGDYSQNVIYIQAHCDDVNELSAAILQTKEKFGQIDGIIHSAMVLNDSLLVNMTESSFAAVLQPKVAGAIALNQATLHEKIDFIIFFSSLQSFVGNIGQSNYATASNFLDGYAKYMGKHRSYPVCVINWGYWGEVGAVANDKYRELMLRQGIHSIQLEEGMEAVENILALQSPQAVVVKANRNVLLQIGLDPHFMIEQRPMLEVSAGITQAIIGNQDLFTAFHNPLLRFKHDLDQLMHGAAVALVGILQNLSLFKYPGDFYTLEEATKFSKIIPEHKNIFAEIFNFLVKKGYLSEQDNQFSATKKVQYQGEYHSINSFERAADKLIQSQSEIKTFYPLLHTCLKNYKDIFIGKIAANNVVFPNSSLELVEGVYSGNLASDIYNELVATAVVNQIKAKLNSQSNPEKIKVLEVGAGTGGTTRYVINLLAAHNIAVEYTYTDLWFKLLEHGREKFGKSYPRMSFSVLDISIDPEKQGWQEQFDFVIATNILHATPNIRESLRNVKRLLKPMGCLILNESIKSQDFSTLTFGLLRGWWNSQDRELRSPASPLLPEETWERVMREEGFFALQCLVPTSTDKEDTLVQQVFVARSDGQFFKASTVSKLVKVKNTSVHNSGKSAINKIEAVSIKEYLQPINLQKLYGCTIQYFHCIDSYIDKNDCLWLFLDALNGNALSIQMLEELLDVIAALSTEKPSFKMPKIVYISHHGKYFSLGGDRSLILAFLNQQNPAILKNFAAKVKQVIYGVVSLNALVVTVLQGAAQGGGLEILLCSDFQFVHSSVRLGLPEVKSGLMPGMGGMSFLKQQIGRLQTKKLVLTGELFNAQEAYRIGLISHIGDDPFIEALQFYKTIDNFDTAIYLKKFIDQGKSQQLIQDIDSWVEYLIQHGEWVNKDRISASLRIVSEESRR